MWPRKFGFPVFWVVFFYILFYVSWESQLVDLNLPANLQKLNLFSFGLIKDRLETFCTFTDSDAARTQEEGMGCLTSPVSITASQNIHEIRPAERLPFTLTHPILAAHTPQPSTCRVWLLKGKQKKKCSLWQFFSSEVIRILHVRIATERPPTSPSPLLPLTAAASKKTLSSA